MPVDSSKRSYAVLGTGALGGYYGARLHHSPGGDGRGLEIHFLLHSDHDHVSRNGLQVESPMGDFSIKNPRAYRDAREMPPCDVVLIAIKSTQNHILSDLLPRAIKPGGAVLVMQNGLGIEDEVAQIVRDIPNVHVLGGLAFLCSNKLGPGHIRHLDYGDIRLGEHSSNSHPAGVTDPVRDLAADFRSAGVTVHIEEDLLLARWKKLVWNVPYNGLSVVNNATTDRLMANPPTRALCEAMMREVVAGAAAFGRTIDEDFVQLMLTSTDKMVAYKPSMKLDHEQGRPMEIEAIYGNPLRAAASKGVVMPHVEKLYRRLKSLDASRLRLAVSRLS